MKHGNEKTSEDLKTILEKICILGTELEVNEKKYNQNILQTKNEIEKFKGAISKLSEEDRLKNWSFDELRSLMENKENNRFMRIVTLRSKLALLHDSYKSSLLHYACMYNNISCIKFLLKKGCLVNREDKFGRKAMHDAAVHGSIDAAKSLLSFDGTLINNINNKKKYTPLHHAAINDEEDFVKYLLTRPGIQVNLRDNKNKMADEYNYNSPEYIRIQKMIREYRDQL